MVENINNANSPTTCGGEAGYSKCCFTLFEMLLAVAASMPLPRKRTDFMSPAKPKPITFYISLSIKTLFWLLACEYVLGLPVSWPSTYTAPTPAFWV